MISKYISKLSYNLKEKIYEFANTNGKTSVYI